ncbi:hypothetical protein BDV39DRAFT_171214 [Aspergillus sergii]|uniref:Secreted protein n=1 Tax=Aspergillus sergii TaxID=1034303 RepID=A0A5N6XAB0_9EURO|nr:hypothetical protein BDV39DRAFT_171214 [Aspergillus sergii]
MKYILPALFTALALATAAVADRLPWIDEYHSGPCSVSRGNDESACGTAFYCQLQGNSHKIGGLRYESEKACLAAHEPRPWVEHYTPACAFLHGTSEKHCGTEFFCRLHSSATPPSKLYESEEECLSFHQPRPEQLRA